MKYISSIAMATGILGALLIALNIDMFIVGYALFLTSSTFWVVYAYKSKQQNLLVMNVVFGMINLIGLVNFI